MFFTLLLDRPGVCALASFYLFHTLMLAKANTLRSQILSLLSSDDPDHGTVVTALAD